jgi:hypothetical protein
VSFFINSVITSPGNVAKRLQKILQPQAVWCRFPQIWTVCIPSRNGHIMGPPFGAAAPSVLATFIFSTFSMFVWHLQI